MKHETIIKREDGTQYKLTVEISIIHYEGNFRYYFSILTKQNGKKKWVDVPDTLHDYQFRSLSIEDREKHYAENALRFVTLEEIYNAKLELWNKLKPEL